MTKIRALELTVIVLALCVALLATDRVQLVKSQPQHAHYFVSPGGSDTDNDGLTPDMPFETIQHALEVAQPGDTINLAPDTFYEDIETVRSGTPDAPITITGTSESIIRGDGAIRVFQVFHDYIVLEGFVIDGRREDGDEDEKDTYRNKLLYAVGLEENDGIEGLRILNMTFRNAGEECVRLRYFAQYNEIAYSRFQDCGIYDFRFDDGGSVGEAIYVGTSSNQWSQNPTNGPDETAFNWIHHNRMTTNGNECVEMKEGTHDNIVEHNICSTQQDRESGGIVSRGNHNIIRFNEIYENKGAGVRLGGHVVDGTQYGIQNVIYGNRIYDNEGGGIKYEAPDQLILCGNFIDQNERGSAVGEHGDLFTADVPCDADIVQQMPAGGPFARGG